jgi:hypothetical protein
MTGMSVSQDVQTIKVDIERPAAGIGFPRTLRLLVHGKNIHEDTLLATDYLNHFNEIVMLLELIADMPECLDDALEWQPKSYEDHFSESSFQDKALAVLAYENAPRRYREPFDQLVAQMDATVIKSLKRIQEVTAEGDVEHLRHIVAGVSKKMQRFVDVASAVIHGREITSAQDEIDTLLTETDDPDDATETTDTETAAPDTDSVEPLGQAEGASQDEIDALFD